MKKKIMVAGILIAVAIGGVSLALVNQKSRKFLSNAVQYTQEKVARSVGKTPAPLLSQSATANRCEKHGITACPFCHPEIVEQQGQCAEHGVPEALCSICHPTLAAVFQAEGDWCGEHNTPESQCVLCHPQLQKNRAPVQTEESTPGVVREEIPRSQRAPEIQCKTHLQRIRLASPELARQVGLVSTDVESRPFSETLVCYAEVGYDETRYIRISSPLSGTLHSIAKRLGDAVKAGDVLATMNSPALGTAKAAYLQALAIVEMRKIHCAREKELFTHKLSVTSTVQEAEIRLAESRIAQRQAQQKLKNFGLSAAEITQLRQKEETTSLLSLTAPGDGVVVECNNVVGEIIEATKPFLAIAGLSTMWAFLDVYETDMEKIHLGQPVVLRVDGLRGETFGGRITWIATQLNPRTRTLKVRADIDNQRGRLRAHMFGRAVVTLHDRESVLLVSKDSVQWDGCCNVVFVKLNDLLYEPRKVKLGCQTEDFYEVESGLQDGETVITQGSFLLKTEILKGNIGAGCCDAGSS